jgi:four helix bundle protein
MTAETSSQGFRHLLSWQLAHELASMVYRASGKLPDRHPWLQDRIRRAAVSVPANIAEGHGRGTIAEFLRFIDIVRGSLSEVEYYLVFLESEHLLHVDEIAQVDAKPARAGRVLSGLWRSLKARAWEPETIRVQSGRKRRPMKPSDFRLVLPVTGYRLPSA